MFKNLASRSLSVENLFSAPFLFLSPSFQRPFSWQVETAERLLGDIQAAAHGAETELYFLGAVLLVQATSGRDGTAQVHLDGAERVFEIIDGQQRIVTLAILLAVLRDLTAKGGMPLSRRLAHVLTGATRDRPRVTLRGDDNAYLQSCIGAAGATLIEPRSEPATMPQRRMLAIRDFFARSLGSVARAELEHFATFLLDHCGLVAVVTDTIDRAYQMFTTLNDAGEPLTRSDILKAELIGQAPAAEREELTQIWEDIERRIGPEFEQLFSFVRTRSGRGNGQIVEAIRAQVAATPGGAATFIRDQLQPAGLVVDLILRADHKGARESAAINRLLRYLNWLPGQEWVPPLLSFWIRHGSDPAALLAFLRALDRFAYGVRLHGLGVDKRAQRMAAATALIEAGGAAAGPWPPLMASRDELRQIEFSLRDLHRRSPAICRLVLQRLDEHFGGEPITGGEPLTTEHILPLKAGANSQWRKDFPDAETRQKLATCLGNLTLVTEAVNGRAANHDFARKVAIYFEDDSQRISKLTDELRHARKWTVVEIEARLERLTAGMKEMWQFG